MRVNVKAIQARVTAANTAAAKKAAKSAKPGAEDEDMRADEDEDASATASETDDDEGEDSTDTDTDTDQDDAVPAKPKKAKKATAETERARIGAIVRKGASVGMSNLADAFAYDTDIDASVAGALLDAAALDKAAAPTASTAARSERGSFTAAMDRVANPQIATGASSESGGDAIDKLLAQSAKLAASNGLRVRSKTN